MAEEVFVIIQEILPGGGAKILLDDGRVFIVSPSSGGTRTLYTEGGLEVGLIQKLYTPEPGHDLYLISEDMDPLPHIFMEYLIKSVPEALSPEDEAWFEYQEKQSWIFREPNGAWILERFYRLCPGVAQLDELMETIKQKEPAERKRRLNALKKVLDLLDNPDLRSKAGNRDFWVKNALPLLIALDIEVD